MFYDTSHMSGAGWILMTLFWTVLLGLVLTAVIGIWREPHRGTDGRAVLDLRLARGEVSVEEYQKLRATLEGTR